MNEHGTNEHRDDDDNREEIGRLSRWAVLAVWLHDRLLALAGRLTRYTVRLPWDAAVQWPEQCLVCGEGGPDHTHPVSISRVGSWSMFVGIEPPWRRRRLDVPVCRSCHERCTRQARLRWTVPPTVLIVILLSGLVVAQWLNAFAPTAARVVQVTAVIGSIVTAVGIGASIGWLINIYARRDEVCFEFKSREIAWALADANGVDVEEPEPLP